MEHTHVIQRRREHVTLEWLEQFGYAGVFAPVMPTLPYMPTFGVSNVLLFARPGGVLLLALEGNTLVWDERGDHVGVEVEPKPPTEEELGARIEDGLLPAEEISRHAKEFLANDPDN
jgi:hypothetical protein